MSTAPLAQPRDTFIHAVGRLTIDVVSLFGDMTLFALRMLRWLATRLPRGV